MEPSASQRSPSSHRPFGQTPVAWATGALTIRNTLLLSAPLALALVLALVPMYSVLKAMAMVSRFSAAGSSEMRSAFEEEGLAALVVVPVAVGRVGVGEDEG